MSLAADVVRHWFDEYLDTFAACVRGEVDMATLVRSYGVPLIVTTDEGVTNLVTDDEVSAVIQGIIDGLRAGGYHHSEVLHSDVTVLNEYSALYRATVSRRNAENVEIGCPTITYLLAADARGNRIAVLATSGQ